MDEFRSFQKPVRREKKRKWIRKVGKRGKVNRQSNIELKKLFIEKGITQCEKHGVWCPTPEWLSFAHRHKRRWYYGRENLLSDIKQVLLICIPFHIEMEKDAELTEKLFKQKRGNEILNP